MATLSFFTGAGPSSLTGILPFMAPAWLGWIVSGLLLHSMVDYKHYVPKLLLDILEYGKVRGGGRSAGAVSLLSLPKR